MFNLWKKNKPQGITLFINREKEIDIDIGDNLSDQELQILVENLISLEFIATLKQKLNKKLPKSAMQTLNKALIQDIQTEVDNFLESPVITPLEVFKKGHNEKRNYMD